MTEAEKIKALIDHIENLKDATFIRNGASHDCKAAADHLRNKLAYAGDEIKTAGQFIEQIASKSSRSGKAYLIRFKDGREIESGKYLMEELRRLEGSSTQPAK